MINLFNFFSLVKEDMAAPKGNRFWEVRSSHGRKPTFRTPSELLRAAFEYIAWCEDNPLHESKLVTFQGDYTVAKLPRMRAMTLNGLTMFLDITIETWYNYKKKAKGFLLVCTTIEQAIREQKYTGAAANLLNPAIVARDLGLMSDQHNTDDEEHIDGFHFDVVEKEEKETDEAEDSSS